MIRRLRQLDSTISAHAGALLGLGLAGVALHNWRLWRRERTLAERARSERAGIPSLARQPRVSALVAAWNEQAQIEGHIASFLALRYPEVELILCAGGQDETLELARRYASQRVIVLEQHAGEGKQAALARCLAHATGEIIYLTDADCRFEDEALTRLLAPIVNAGEQAATGVSRPLDEQLGKIFPLHLWGADTASALHAPRYSQGLLGRNAALTRAAAERIGGFGFRARTGTDYQLARRLLAHGVRISFVADSVVPSAYPETARSYWRKQSRWMRNLLIHGLAYRAYHQVVDSLRSAAVGLLMLALPWLGLALGWPALWAWLLLIAHATMAKLRYALITGVLYRRRPALSQLLAALPLTLFDFGVWVTPLLELIRRVDRERW